MKFECRQTNKKNIQTHPKSTFSWRFNVFVSVDDCQNDTLLKNHRFMSIHWLFTNNINSILSFCLFPLYITKKKTLESIESPSATIMWFYFDFGAFLFFAENVQISNKSSTLKFSTRNRIECPFKNECEQMKSTHSKRL